ncbi:MAG: hypothetical protein ACQEXJ_20755 [Myxococcota bacterium]
MSGALWVKRDDATAHVVEILPELPDDDTVTQPFVFSPSGDFRYTLHLYASNLESLLRAIDRDPAFARLIADGEALVSSADTARLQDAAEAALDETAERDGGH